MEISESTNERALAQDKQISEIRKICDGELKSMRRTLDEKTNEHIHSVKEVERLKHSENKLRSEVQSLTRQLRDKDVQYGSLEMELKEKLDKLTCTTKCIDGKIDTMNTRNKLKYSDVLKSPVPVVLTPSVHIRQCDADIQHADNRDIITEYSDNIQQPTPRRKPRSRSICNRLQYDEDVIIADRSSTSGYPIVNDDEQVHEEDLRSTHEEETTEQQTEVTYERAVQFENEWSRAFRGASPKCKTKRFVLYFIRADKPLDLIKDAIFNYAKQRDVHVSFIRLLKHWEGYNPTYTLRVNVDSNAANKITENENFWPVNVKCREWIPQSRMNNGGEF